MKKLFYFLFLWAFWHLHFQASASQVIFNGTIEKVHKDFADGTEDKLNLLATQNIFVTAGLYYWVAYEIRKRIENADTQSNPNIIKSSAVLSAILDDKS